MYTTVTAELARLHRADMLSEAARYRRGGTDRRSPEAASRQEPLVRRRRTSAARFGIRAGTVGLIAVVAFLAQDKRGGSDSFLGLHGTLGLVAAMSIAAIGGALATLSFGIARTSQPPSDSPRQP